MGCCCEKLISLKVLICVSIWRTISVLFTNCHHGFFSFFLPLPSLIVYYLT
ncbi:unnamed protein product, partial [Linum tenue]